MSMSIGPKRIIQTIISDEPYCNFCLKYIEEANSYCFDDEITLDNSESVKLSEISNYVLGYQTSTISASGFICQQCMETTIACYKFIQMCKFNFDGLCRAVTILQTETNNINDGHGDKKSLYIAMNEPTCRCKFPLHKAASNHNHTELKKAHDYADYNPGIETLINEYSFESDYCMSNNEINFKEKQSKKTKQKKKRNRLKRIQISDMIFDVNNMSQCKCKICLKTYTDLYRLKQHFLRVHAPKDFVCLECSRSYGSAALLAQHKYDSHSPLMCSDCGKSYTSRSTFKTHVQSHQLKLICQICGKAFKNKRNLSKHILLNICDPVLRKISLEKKYLCDHCSKGYSSKSTLQAHIKFEHGNGAAHTCSWCNKKFNAISRLTAHIVTHTQEKKFSCDLCGGQFVTRESLLYHTRIHTGEKPYQCEHCDKRFLSASRRAEHVKRHHSDPMIECDICHSRFRSRSCLTRHKKRHFNPNSRLHYTRLVSDKEV